MAILTARLGISQTRFTVRRQTPIRPRTVQLRSPRVVTVRAEDSQEEEAPPAWVVDKLPETSIDDFKSMSDDQLLQAISDTKVQLFKLRVRTASRQEVNTGNFRKLKRKVAQMFTILRQREIEQGVGKRESRKKLQEKRKEFIFL